MSFYQTSNASIVRFRTVPRKTVAPFQSLQRIVQIQNIGAGYSTQAAAQAAAITPEQLQNGALIINPGGAGYDYCLPTPYSLQEFLGGRFAFNMAANQVNVSAGANQLNGNNDFFLINIYNLAANTAQFWSYDLTQSKTIAAAAIANDASLTPLLIRFSSVNSPYATINGVANTVTYTIF